MLNRGYNNSGFEAWTIPALYMVAKYLRLFAIRSDAERSAASDIPSGGATLMQDDFDPESEKQSQLRDCEQQLKRLFTLCLNDRYGLCCLYRIGNTDSLLEPLWKSRGNGAFTTSPTSCSRHISS